LSGSIPDDIQKLTNLSSLNLEQNEISGAVPAGFAGLSSLEHLDLSDNKFSGELPSDMFSGCQNTLDILDLCNNTEVRAALSACLLPGSCMTIVCVPAYWRATFELVRVRQTVQRKLCGLRFLWRHPSNDRRDEGAQHF
jgi:hypothetical protein